MAVEADQTIKTPVVLLTGASSQIGLFAIRHLRRAGFRVLAMSRKGRPEGFPDLVQVEWLNEVDAAKASQDCQYLLSAGPMELAQKFLVSAQLLRSAVVFSSSSVESKQKSGNPEERVQIEGMLASELELRKTAEKTGLKLVILRPTLIYGCGLDTNITRLARWIGRFGFMPVNGSAAGLRQPVHADDLASVAVAAMIATTPLPGVLPLCGGETLSYTEMVNRIFSALGKPARLVHLPEWSFLLLLYVVRIFRMGGGINSEMVRRQAVDLVFDDQLARKLLNYHPRPFAPDMEDFSLPDFSQLLDG